MLNTFMYYLIWSSLNFTTIIINLILEMGNLKFAEFHDLSEVIVTK